MAEMAVERTWVRAGAAVRPKVKALAWELGLRVDEDRGAVKSYLYVEGPASAIDEFLDELEDMQHRREARRVATAAAQRALWRNRWYAPWRRRHA